VSGSRKAPKPGARAGSEVFGSVMSVSFAR
jgi:hypothetical protein